LLLSTVRRWLTIAIMSLLLVTMALPLTLSPSMAHAQGTFITVSPTQGPPGAQVTASGGGFPVNDPQIQIWFDQTYTGITIAANAQGNFSVGFSVPTNATQGLHPVYATDGSARASTSFNVTAGAAPPAAPQGARAIPYGPFHIRVGWVDYANNESGFQIFNGVTSNYAPASSGTGAVVWYQWSVSAPNTYMCFRVRAYNSGGYSAWAPTNTYVCATSDPGGTPKPPTNVTAQGVNSSSIQITFVDQANNETAFQFWNGNVIRTVLAEVPGTGSTVAWDWTGLAPHTYMCFKVRTYNDYGASAWAPANGWACTSSTG